MKEEYSILVVMIITVAIICLFIFFVKKKLPFEEIKVECKKVTEYIASENNWFSGKTFVVRLEDGTITTTSSIENGQICR